MSRIFAIPDIHGRFDLLQDLMLKLEKEEELSEADKVIFLGDMVDRGPQSADVIYIVRKLTEKYENMIALAGNHEWLMIDAISKPTENSVGLWLANGGGATLKSYPQSDRAFTGPIGDDVKWLASLPLFHVEQGFFFSHAPLPKDKDRGENKGKPWTKHELIWTYFRDEEQKARKLDDGVIGVCGHVHQLWKGVRKPRLYDHYIFADAGAGCHPDAPLVAVEVASRKVIYAHPKDLADK